MKRYLRYETAAIVTLAGGIMFALLAWYFAGKLIERGARADFENKARFAVGLIERRIERYIDLLYGLEGLFSRTSSVSREDFQRYVETLDTAKRFPGVQALEFIRRVGADGREEFIRAVRNDRSVQPGGYPSFDIKPSGARREYLIVDYIEPMRDNEAAFGFDGLTRPESRLATDRARDTEEPVSTSGIKLVQDKTQRAGLVVFVAVYRGFRPARTIAERRADLVGYVNAVFRVDDLFAGVLDAELRNILRVDIHDVGPATVAPVASSSEDLLFKSHPQGAGAAPPLLAWAMPEYTYRQVSKVAGRSWALEFENLDSYGSPWLQPLPMLALSAGLVISLLLFLVLRTISRSRMEALRMAQTATGELRDQLGFNQQLLEAIPNPVFFKDTDGRYLGCNRAFEAYIGIERDKLVGKTVYDIAPPDLADTYFKADKALFDHPGTQVYETSVLFARDGERHDVIFNKATFLKSDGSAGGLVGILIDITQRKQLERSINESNQRLRSIIEASPLAIIARDLNTVIQMWNPAAERMFGWKAEEVVGTAQAVVPPDLREETAQLRKRAASGEMIFLEETRRQRKDGTVIDVSVSIAPIYDALGNTSGTMVVIADISRRKQAETALRESEAQLRLALEAASMGSWYWDLTEKRLTFSDGFGPLFGLKRATFFPDYPQFLAAICEDDREAVDAAIRRAVKQSNDFVLECRVQWPDGSVHWLATNGQVFRDASGWALRMIGVAADVSERKRAEQRIAFMAHHDALTGLPNRALLRDRIGQAIAYAHRGHSQLAVLFIDLDRFKNINDSLGHESGDLLLQAVASRIKTCLREGDTVSRLGGDEFVIVLPEVADGQDAAAVAGKVLEVLSSSFHLQGHDLHISASIGVSIYPNDGEDAETLMRNADTAMYHAKDSGRANYQFFTQHLNVSAQQRLKLESDLRRALERDEFVLLYQPIFATTSRALVGVEALLRWHHPERGVVMPDEFLPVAEDSGLIHRIGEWVLEQACAQAGIWQRRGHLLKVAVNISANQLRRKTFHDRLRTIVQETGVEPRLLELEITESVIVEGSEDSIRALNLVDGLGIRLAVDDFGTGYSGLSYLKRFPIDTVKIDQSFIRDITVDPDDAAIVRAIVAMATSLKLAVVAEGVETAEQLAFLQSLGCDMAQGFFLGTPMPPEQLEDGFGVARDNMRAG